MVEPTENVTDLLLAAHDGDRQAADELMRAVYSDLRRKAAALLRRERPGTPSTPSLVHEAYIRLIDNGACVANAPIFSGCAEMSVVS